MEVYKIELPLEFVFFLHVHTVFISNPPEVAVWLLYLFTCTVIGVFRDSFMLHLLL